MITLFVYGTLTDPRRMAAVLGAAVDTSRRRPGTVHGVLYDLGDYPGLQLDDAAGAPVPGVVLELDDDALAPLDAYEGVHQGLYVRRQVPVRLDDGGTVRGWVYLYAGPIAGRPRLRAWPAMRG